MNLNYRVEREHAITPTVSGTGEGGFEPPSYRGGLCIASRRIRYSSITRRGRWNFLRSGIDSGFITRHEWERSPCKAMICEDSRCHTDDDGGCMRVHACTCAHVCEIECHMRQTMLSCYRNPSRWHDRPPEPTRPTLLYKWVNK